MLCGGAAAGLLALGLGAWKMSSEPSSRYGDEKVGGPRLFSLSQSESDSADPDRAGVLRIGRNVAPPRPVSGPEVKHDRSPPLRTIPPKPHPPRKEREEHKIPVPAASTSPDPVVQTSKASVAALTAGKNFDGISAQGSAPPDPNGAAGPSAYVQIVNQSFQVFSKTGASLYGPAPTNTLWTGFGGGCEANDDGDATVDYDRLANRWIIQQFSVSTTPYLECIAVSTTGDPTGSWNRYSFSGFGTNFPDYPKLSVWPDAYYVTYNLFASAIFFVGPEVCAYDRAKMLAGTAATQQCKPVSNTNLGGLLASDVDSPTAPPAGSPNYVLAFDTGALKLWKFHVDWITPANSTLTGPTTIPVAAFSPACGGGACVPQSGTSQKLDSLGDRLMYRLAYRNFGDHESLVVSHSVTAGASVGERWYELRSPNATPTVFQQGTYAPDSAYRWMGSAAMDGNGDIALGFSTSSATAHPGIAYTGRLAGDPLGTMTQGESVLVAGPGSQTGGLERWGDYSSLSIDPSDDCTFWYTNEYLPSNGSFNWKTRIGSFSFPGCGGAVANDFSISASPASVSVQQGQSGGSTINTAVTSGSAQSVSLSASGQPAGTSVSFSPSSVTAGGSSTMTINVGAGTATGSYTITVTGTGTSATHSTTVSLTVTAAPASDFSISASPASVSIQQGQSGGSTINTAVTSGSAQSLSLSASGQPAGTTVSFSPGSVTAGGSSTMTISVGAGTATGSYTITVTGTGSSATHSTTVSLTVTAAAADFSMSANPTSLTIRRGSKAKSTISTAVVSGSAQTVNLSASGMPAGVSVSFSRLSVVAGNSSQVTVKIGSSATRGTSFVITVTGTGSTATHTATVNVQIP